MCDEEMTGTGAYAPRHDARQAIVFAVDRATGQQHVVMAGPRAFVMVFFRARFTMYNRAEFFVFIVRLKCLRDAGPVNSSYAMSRN